MAPFFTLTLTAVMSVVLASSTTSSREQLMHKSQSWNSTRSDGLYSTLTAHAGTAEAMTTTKQLLPHLPWLSNCSAMATQTAASGSMTSPTATVVVGKGGELVFSPSSLNATAGSVISFNFLGLNHSLTKSDFGNPCQGNGGFDTGFGQFNPTNSSGRFVVNYVVQDNTPQWFFCAQTMKRPHCQAGMVFSLNAHGRHAQFLNSALSAVTPSPTTADSACHLPISETGARSTGIYSYPTGTVSAGLGASSGAVFPPISNSGSANRACGIGMVLALALM